MNCSKMHLRQTLGDVAKPKPTTWCFSIGQNSGIARFMLRPGYSVSVKLESARAEWLEAAGSAARK